MSAPDTNEGGAHTESERICVTCGEKYAGSWTGECNDCEKSTLALWLDFATAEKREDPQTE